MPSTTRSSASSAIVMTASLSAGPDAEALRVAPVRDAVEHGSRLLAPPAERAEVGRRHLARRCQEDRRELATRRLPRRQALRQLPLPCQELVGERAPPPILLDQVRVLEHQPPMQR